MAFADHIGAPQERWEAGLARLRMLADGEAGVALPGQMAAEVRETTNTVIAEADACGRAALAASARARGELEAQTFLLVRLARLAQAADQAVTAARTADANGLRRHLHRFDALASAMWAVQHAGYGQVPLPWPQGGPSPAASGLA